MVKWIAWVDLETTGLDPRRDFILEVGLAVTRAEPDLFVETELHFVVNPGLDPRTRAWEERMEPEVQAMHRKSGLLRETLAGVSLTAAEDAMVQTLERFSDHQNFALGGSGVAHFDAPFIARHLPKFQEHLLPGRFVDVSIMRRWIRDVCGREDIATAAQMKDPLHRAIEDIRDHISEVRIYNQYLRES